MSCLQWYLVFSKYILVVSHDKWMIFNYVMWSPMILWSQIMLDCLQGYVLYFNDIMWPVFNDIWWSSRCGLHMILCSLQWYCVVSNNIVWSPMLVYGLQWYLGDLQWYYLVSNYICVVSNDIFVVSNDIRWSKLIFVWSPIIFA